MSRSEQPRSRGALWLLLVALLISFGIVATGPRAPSGPGPRTDTPAGGDHAGQAPTRADRDRTPPPSDARGPTETAGAPTPDTEVSDGETSPTGRLGFTGTVRIAGSDTVVGSVTFRLIRAGGGKGGEGSGDRGEVEGGVPAAGEYYVANVMVDGREWGGGLLPVRITRDGPIEIVLPARAPATLLVRDAATRAPLARPRAWRWNGAARATPWFPRPEPESTLVGDTAGRIDLPAAAGETKWVVTADGYVFGAVAVEQGAETEREVLLGAAGSLRVAVANWGSLDRAVLEGILPSGEVRKVPDHLGPVGAALAVDAEFRLDHLPPGPLTLRVACNGPGGAAVAAGPAEVEIVAGEERLLELNAVAPTGGEGSATATLLVSLPREWEARDLEVEVLRLGGGGGYRPALELTDLGGDEIRAVEVEGLLPGRHLVLVESLQWQREIDVTDGVNRIDLALPRPATVTLTALDDGTGEPLSDVGFTWTRSSPSSAWQILEVVTRAETGTATLQVPPGTVTLSAGAWNRLPEEIERTLREGEAAEQLFRLRPAAEIEVVITLDGKRAEGRTFRVFATAEDPAPQSAVSISFDCKNGGRVLDSIDPGRWELSIPGAYPGAADFEGREPRTVETRSGERTVVTFDLRSAK